MPVGTTEEALAALCEDARQLAEGNGVERDAARAAALYEVCSSTSLHSTCLGLYEGRRSCPVDVTPGLRFALQTAAANGHAGACVALAAMCLKAPAHHAATHALHSSCRVGADCTCMFFPVLNTPVSVRWRAKALPRMRPGLQSCWRKQ